ncbi:hypothetical protein B0H13DRAFT_1871725 [Mycena leptocephala]|nr:hypothetical protein B0H13DRAFT_1871725 [Mycena leptocephala]
MGNELPTEPEPFEASENTPTNGTIMQISSLEQLAEILGRPGAKGSVINFGRPGCPGCHAIEPYWIELSRTYQDSVNFLMCDFKTPESIHVTSFYRIKAMPTFVFFKGDRQMEKVISDSREKLHEGILKVAGKRRYSGSF